MKNRLLNREMYSKVQRGFFNSHIQGKLITGLYTPTQFARVAGISRSSAYRMTWDVMNSHEWWYGVDGMQDGLVVNVSCGLYGERVCFFINVM